MLKYKVIDLNKVHTIVPKENYIKEIISSFADKVKLSEKNLILKHFNSDDKDKNNHSMIDQLGSLSVIYNDLDAEIDLPEEDFSLKKGHHISYENMIRRIVCLQTHENQLIGAVHYDIYPLTKKMHIESIQVIPYEQQKGYGNILLQAALLVGFSYGIIHCELQTILNAHSLYFKNGFNLSEENYYQAIHSMMSSLKMDGDNPESKIDLLDNHLKNMISQKIYPDNEDNRLFVEAYEKISLKLPNSDLLSLTLDINSKEQFTMLEANYLKSNINLSEYIDAFNKCINDMKTSSSNKKRLRDTDEDAIETEFLNVRKKINSPPVATDSNRFFISCNTLDNNFTIENSEDESWIDEVFNELEVDNYNDWAI